MSRILWIFAVFAWATLWYGKGQVMAGQWWAKRPRTRDQVWLVEKLLFALAGNLLGIFLMQFQERPVWITQASVDVVAHKSARSIRIRRRQNGREAMYTECQY